MRASFLLSLLLLLGAGACGGAIDDASDSPTPASGKNAPTSTTPDEGCARACERMTKTCAAWTDDDGACVRSCRSDFGGDGAAAQRYAACLDALPCSEIERGMTMNYGPIGECHTRARRGF